MCTKAASFSSFFFSANDCIILCNSCSLKFLIDHKIMTYLVAFFMFMVTEGAAVKMAFPVGVFKVDGTRVHKLYTA